MEIRIREFTLKILMLFPIFTLLAFVPAATTILAVLGLAGMTYNILQFGLKKVYFLLVVAVGLLTLWNYKITGENIIHINEVTYFMYLCVFTVFLVTNGWELRDCLLENKKYIKNICLLWCIIVVVSMLFPFSYDEGVFVSFAVTTYRLSPSAIFIMALSGVLIAGEEERNLKGIIYTFIALLAILLGASRTYLFIGGLMLLFNMSMLIKRKSMFYLLIVLLSIIGFLIILNSPMGEKIINSMTEREYQNPLSVFTNGRSDFWRRDIEAFQEQPIVNQLFGCGFNFVRIVNGAVVGTSERGIWAHNDFIQILATYGYTGLILYLINMRVMFKKMINHKIPFFIGAVLLMIWLFNAVFNMYFTYTCSMIALPISLMVCDIYKQNHERWFEE